MAYDAVTFLEGLYGRSSVAVAGGAGTVPEPVAKSPPSIGPDDLPGDWRVEWEERAAIREFDGGQTREHAEAEALTEIVARMRAAGVSCRFS